MQYFTLSWWMGYSEMTDDQPLRLYAEHFEHIRHSLPRDLTATYDVVSLHDSHLRQLDIDVEAGLLRVQLDAINAQGKRWRILMTYLGLQSFHSQGDPKVGLAGPHGYGDLGYEEIGIAKDGSLEHRLLFSNGIEMAIRFRDFRLESQNEEAGCS